MKTMHENEREYIIKVLKQCNGKIWGAGGRNPEPAANNPYI